MVHERFFNGRKAYPKENFRRQSNSSVRCPTLSLVVFGHFYFPQLTVPLLRTNSFGLVACSAVAMRAVWVAGAKPVNVKKPKRQTTKTHTRIQTHKEMREKKKMEKAERAIQIIWGTLYIEMFGPQINVRRTCQELNIRFRSTTYPKQPPGSKQEANTSWWENVVFSFVDQ